MKRIFTAALTLVLLASLSAASAGGGTAQDPLISQSYIDGEYTSGVLAQGEKNIEASLDGVYGDAIEKLGDLSGANGFSFASGYDGLVVPAGGTVELTFGSGALLTYGGAAVSISSGSVIDISTGEELSGSFTMAKNRRYFCTEDTSATVTAAERSVIFVNGGYYAPSAQSVFTQYSDVNFAEWFYDAAKYVYDNKLFHDWSEDTFKPDAVATRAELVYALWMACGSPEPSSTATFDDLEPGWYLDAASWAAENDIVRGYSDNKYMPYNGATRQEIAVIMYRYAKYMGYSVDGDNDLSGYVDANEIADWAEREMRWANAEGLITGTTDVNLAPLKTAWRSEIATIIMRYIEAR